MSGGMATPARPRMSVERRQTHEWDPHHLCFPHLPHYLRVHLQPAVAGDVDVDAHWTDAIDMNLALFKERCLTHCLGWSSRPRMANGLSFAVA